MIIILWTRATTSTVKNYVSYVFSSYSLLHLFYAGYSLLGTVVLQFRPDKFMGSPNNERPTQAAALGRSTWRWLFPVAAVVLPKTDNKHRRATLDYLLKIVFQESHKLISKSFSGSREVSVPFPWLVVGSREDRDCNQWWWSRERYIRTVY